MTSEQRFFLVTVIVGAGEERTVRVEARTAEQARRIVRERYPAGHLISTTRERL